MGIKKHHRTSRSSKGSGRHLISSLRYRIDTGPQLNKPRARAAMTKPLHKLFDRRGMRYGRHRVLRTVRNDNQLRREFYKVSIRDRNAADQALLELLFQCRNLRYWESGGDNLVDVFRLLKGRISWASHCSVDLIMQIFFALIRARLDCPARLRQNAGKVAQRVDKVIRVSTT
jgi:hypothetical protein